MLEPAEILTILAIFFGPIAAVQVQKWLDSYRESRSRRIEVFKTLMATRAAAISKDHVQALNMIDLEFNSKKYIQVTRAWKTYLDHLSSFPKENQNQQGYWSEKRIDYLAALLEEMGKSLGYQFDQVHIKKGIYAPEAHGKLETEQELMRKGVLELLSGERNLNINIARTN
ncbi:MAG: DUF6680 family protein [Pseudomonadota bacterium]|nr:DUF6680 family protein [Pseudomonadota bacterium]